MGTKIIMPTNMQVVWHALNYARRISTTPDAWISIGDIRELVSRLRALGAEPLDALKVTLIEDLNDTQVVCALVGLLDRKCVELYESPDEDRVKYYFRAVPIDQHGVHTTRADSGDIELFMRLTERLHV